ncbi:hypothetical protein [Psychrobacillus sp.]|uniref:hypothetical protein n=1 Tax=Psychrobacillus sp. TaxID=1871623 RepID=UPI0028BEDBD8|nr:hypothetical protein [Psychrobacillus sp.]
MNKVEFKKDFEIGYDKMEFSANDDQTFISIENKYSVPSSMVSPTIVHIKGSLFEERRWGWIFTDLVEVESDINAPVSIKLDRFEIDAENFNEESFVQHLIEEATEKIKESNYNTSLKTMTII